MDAKITKHRLSNLLGYDWLKMLGAIAAALAVLAILFTIVGTRPTIAQKYAVYSMGGLVPNTGCRTLADDLDKRLSYEILEVSVENFADSDLGNSAFTARRSVLEGNAILVANALIGKDTITDFAAVASSGVADAGTPDERMGMFYEIPAFFADCEAYLARFFGENWKTAPLLNEAEVRECFLQRNGSDKRFRSEEKREEGIMSERQRLETLLEDYQYVRANEDKFDLTDYTTVGYEGEEGHVSHSFTVGIDLSRLSGLSDLVYYADAEGNITADKVTLLLLNNGEHVKDVKYESVTFLRYLLETYQ